MLQWWLWLDWLYCATPSEARRAEAERRLLKFSGTASAAIERYERKRAANAERLMRFYGRAVMPPAPFVASPVKAERP
jgi:hypothetical protein